MQRALVFGVLTLTAFLTSAYAHAKKDACTRSCSNIAETCVNMGATRGACFADMASCMKTGQLKMPSGRVFTNLCKR